MFVSAAFGAVVGVAHFALEHLATLLTPFAGGLAGPLAIVVFTLLVRLLISPLTYVQVRAERRRAALAPQLEELRRKHSDDRVALATETLALQRAAGVGPFVSLLPGLAQTPFFMIMFRLVHPAATVVTGLLAGALFGVPLTAHVFSGAPGLAVFAALLALGVVLARWNSRRLRRTQAAAADNAAKPSDPRAKVARPDQDPRPKAGRPDQDPRPKAARPDQGRGAAAPGEGVAAAIARILPWMPYMTVVVMAYLPLAGALYLLTSTAWTALEHAMWRRPITKSNQ
jgi:YidC/Oxa1 family membrane protein insertase